MAIPDNQLDQLLEIENDRKLFSFTFRRGQFPLWVFVRFFFLQRCVEQRLKIENPWRNASKKNLVSLCRFLMLSFLYHPLRLHHHYPLVFFGSDISNTRCGGFFENRLTEYFAREFDSQTLVIEKSDRGSFHRPKKRRTMYLDWLYLMAKLKGLVTPAGNRLHREITKFIEYLKLKGSQYFKPDAPLWGEIERELTNSGKHLPHLLRYFRLLLKRLSPKVIFIEDACAGSHTAVLIQAAKSLGIRVAEFQHGLLSRNHPSYNFAALVKSTNYARCLPDDFLFFGSYWRNNSRIPARPIIIGYPFLQEAVKSSALDKDRTIILFISSGLDKKRYIREVLRLKERLAGTAFCLVFRPHPGEFHSIATDYAPLIRHGIEIHTGDLYSLLAHTKCLIAEISTVVFEALAFHIVPFVVRSSASNFYFDSSHFIVIDAVDDVFNRLDSSHASPRLNEFWDPDWRGNYRKYVESFLDEDGQP